ncbi:MAG TPA: response regulator transcription factor [Opitutaceae bacterium]|jgi:DNA-binding response OmpR family regulator|nr:response regulator transcription factor [Opitutaceae bacterium]
MCAAIRSEPKPLILVVEDEEELAKLIAIHLEEAGMQAQIYNRCAHALRFLKRNFANLILLDVNLPDQSGFSLLEELWKNDINIPTIFLTGNALEMNKVKGLELGGDDYITKPFGYPELIARIHAVLRRAESKGDFHVTKNAKISDEPFDFCGAKIMPVRLEVTFPNGAVQKIGRKELGILAHLNENQGTVITRKALIHAVWGLHADVRSRSLDQYIVKVRELFKNNELDLGSFRTVHGVGYIFDPQGVSTEGR